MSYVRIECEVLIAGRYPFSNNFEKNGFKLEKNTVEEELFEKIEMKGLIYLSPYLGYCVYPDVGGEPVYLTFKTEKQVDINYPKGFEYDRKITNEYLKKMDVHNQIDNLEKLMILETNNNIKFPARSLRAYDANNQLVGFFQTFTKINVPTLITNNNDEALDVVKKQNNRLGLSIAYDKVLELENENMYFHNALSVYYSSFSVTDTSVSFVLLITALESLLSKSTYEKVERCSSCNQEMFKLRATISENVSKILMDSDENFIKELKALYDKRSAFVHKGEQNISLRDKQLCQEYVRKTLLMYWIVSLKKRN